MTENCELCLYLNKDSTCSKHRVYMILEDERVQPKEFYITGKTFCSFFERKTNFVSDKPIISFDDTSESYQII